MQPEHARTYQVSIEIRPKLCCTGPCLTPVQLQPAFDTDPVERLSRHSTEHAYFNTIMNVFNDPFCTIEFKFKYARIYQKPVLSHCHQQRGTHTNSYQYFPLNFLSFKEHWSIKIKTTTKMICIPLLNKLSKMDRYFFSHLPNFYAAIFLKIIKHVIYIGCMLKAKEAG